MNSKTADVSYRKTAQRIAPAEATTETGREYNLYPSFEIENGAIYRGYKELFEKIKNYNKVVIDGYVGVFWQNMRNQLDEIFGAADMKVNWINVSRACLNLESTNEMLAPYLGGDDPLFGTRFDGSLKDFFNSIKLEALDNPTNGNIDITILYGCGAYLAAPESPLVYIDLPKNELQFRSRAQQVCNLGNSNPDAPHKMYKRFYFVDWPVLNKHKKEVLSHIDWIVDGQRPDDPTIMSGNHFRKTLRDMSQNYFRPRPWFEPGTWGGQWCTKHIPSLPKDPENYAWSFELISPENGLMFSDNNYLLEVSFDWLMYQENKAVLGESADQFGYEFPIRFDFLDTFEGGNLSVQCHPKPSFIREEFGESFTQNETYYMIDCKPDSQVYLGFQPNINAEEFRSSLEESAENNSPVKIGDYVQTFPAHRHDLFLIPHGTIHCSGTNNMVLEISATPYIFTFKMYDWLRSGLDGQPRPLNIDRAFENLNFEYKGQRVEQELISKPHLLEEGEDWRVIHLPTHKHHFYDVHQLEFEDEIELATDGSCQVMSLVEGESILLQTENGREAHFSYVETFVVPAAAKSFRLKNEGAKPAKVVKAFIKSNIKLSDY